MLIDELLGICPVILMLCLSTQGDVDTCTFSGNKGRTGSGLFQSSGDSTITNSVFSSNTGTGAVYRNDMSGDITSSTFRGNTGGWS